MSKPRYITSLTKVPELSEEEQQELTQVTEQFDFRSNDYYQQLIDWDDPDDPIRRLIMPDLRELEEWGDLDPSGEESYVKVKGLEHKYSPTALLLCSDVCAGYCRYCFRKRLFMRDNDEIEKDVSLGVEYIAAHPEITNVLLTGGDPLILSTSRLRAIIAQLRAIPHVRIIRIGTKLPAFNPYRIVDDPELLQLIRDYTLPDKKIYIMSHFDHPRELTDVAVAGLQALLDAGAIIQNQHPIITGINDNPETLVELWNRLSAAGVTPYYLFQCRPALGNAPYTMPIERALAIFEAARSRTSGLAKRVRYMMSHRTGKIEICGMTESLIFFKYHSAAKRENDGRMLIFERNPEAAWLDDYTELVDTHVISSELQAHHTAA
ncbi:MAG: KamA family radical SAM protein [Verrucomicrobia bacterium]|nr:KamA family radical SAM protein [Verrucomicrobiota bacterium]